MPAVGGRSVRPYQPPKGVTNLTLREQCQMEGEPGAGSLSPRPVYSFPRTVPYPQLMNFDAPDTNSAGLPEGALEHAATGIEPLERPCVCGSCAGLGGAYSRETPGQPLADARAATFRDLSCTGPPSPSRTGWLVRLLQASGSDLRKGPEHPPSVLSCGARPGSQPNRKLAAWTGLASALLNLDEFITRE